MKSLRITKAASIAVLSSALVMGGATAATADDANGNLVQQSASAASAAPGARSAARVTAARPVDIVSISGSKVMTYKSKYVNVRYRAAKTSGVSSYYVLSAGVYHGSKWVGSAGSYPLYSGGSGAPNFRNSWGRGFFTLKNLRIRVYMKDGSTREYTDNVRGGFRVRSGVEGKLKYGNVIHMTRKGSHKSVKVGLKRFTPTGWHGYKTKAIFQVRKPGHWKSKKKIKLNSKGIGRYKFSDSKRRKYRVVIKATGYTAGGKTRGLKI